MNTSGKDKFSVLEEKKLKEKGEALGIGNEEIQR